MDRTNVFLSLVKDDLPPNLKTNFDEVLSSWGLSVKEETTGIDSCDFSIVVFSDNSLNPKSLSDLAKIIDRCILVIPVFYYIDPSHVRNQNGEYLDSFRKLEEKHDLDEISRWKKAIKEAGAKKGWVYGKDSREESYWIESIAQRILTYSSSFSSPTYDVFLSFSGKDTRLGFTKRLYHELLKHGINTFLDDEGLRLGEDIASGLVRAIKNSRTSIIILSKNYTTKWCLNELFLILSESKQDEPSCQSFVKPVLFNVKRSHVIRQRGCFRDAFGNHEKRFSNEQVTQWRDAMNTAAKHPNCQLYRPSKEKEIQFINSIVQEIKNHCLSS